MSLGADNDPHGPSNAPLLSEQRSYLEEVLTSLGFSYTITVNSADFTRELRTGTYSNYALFSEQIKIDEQVQKELREAIYRGGNLLIAGDHDRRNEKLQTIFAAKIKGELDEPTSLVVNEIEKYNANNLPITLKDKVSRIELRGAGIVAVYPGLTACKDDDKSDEKDTDKDESDEDEHQGCTLLAAAIVHNNYGFGHSVYVGFDLLAQATMSVDDPLYYQLLSDVLKDTRADTSTIQTGDVVAISLKLVNQGISTPGQIKITLPEGSNIIDAGPAEAQTDGSLLWRFTLDEEATEILVFWLQLSDVAGVANIEGVLQTGVAPTFNDYDDLLLTLNVIQSPTLQEVIDDLAQLVLLDENYKKAHEKLIKSLQYEADNKLEKSLKNALKAADKLDDIDDPQADAIRRKLGFAIRELEKALL